MDATPTNSDTTPAGAWEARRAERDNLPEVHVVTRTIEVDKPVSHAVEVPVPVQPRAAGEWSILLETFATRLTQARMHRRDLPTLDPAVRRLVEVWNRNQLPPR